MGLIDEAAEAAKKAADAATEAAKEQMFKASYPALYAYTQEVKKEGLQNPGMKDKYSALETSLKSIDLNDPTVRQGIKAMDTNLADSVFKQQLKDLAIKNPEALRMAMPQILGNAGGMKQAVAAEHGKAFNPVKPATAAAPPESRPSPVETAAAATQKSPAAAPQKAAPPTAASVVHSPSSQQPQPQNQAAAATPQTAAPTAAVPAAASAEPKAPLGLHATVDQKLDFIQSRPGYKEFYDTIKSNKVPAVTEAYQAMVKPKDGASEADIKGSLDKIIKATESEPQFFVNMNKTINEKPGLASRIAGTISDPNSLAGKLMGGFTGMQGLAIYSNFAQSGIGQMLNSLLEMFGVKGGLDKLVNGLLDMVGGQYKAGNSGQAVVLGTGAIARQADRATGTDRGQTTQVSPDGTKREMSGDEFRKGPQTPEQQRAAQQPVLGTPQAGV